MSEHAGVTCPLATLFKSDPWYPGRALLSKHNSTDVLTSLVQRRCRQVSLACSGGRVGNVEQEYRAESLSTQENTKVCQVKALPIF